MTTRGGRNRAALAATLPLAFVIAHEVAYRVVFPDAAQRHQALAHAGHGYWPLLAAIALATAATGALSALRSGSRGETRTMSVSQGLVALLSGGATVGFETIERLVTHAGFGNAFVSLVLVASVSLVGCVLASRLFLRTLAAVGRLLAALVRTLAASAAGDQALAAEVSCRPRDIAGLRGARAPPRTCVR